MNSHPPDKHEEATGFFFFFFFEFDVSRWTPQGLQVWPLLAALFQVFPASCPALVCWLVLLGFVCVLTRNHKRPTLSQRALYWKDNAIQGTNKVQPSQLLPTSFFCQHPTEGTTFHYSLSPPLFLHSSSFTSPQPWTSSFSLNLLVLSLVSSSTRVCHRAASLPIVTPPFPHLISARPHLGSPSAVLIPSCDLAMHPSMIPSPDASLPGIAHYTFLRQLGQGRFCVVHLGRHFYTQKMYAVKVIDKQVHRPDILLRLRREIELMESLDHPNIVKLHEVIETQFSIYVCMEYVEGCSLEQLLKNQLEGRLSESDARRITRELASAVSHCHSRFVVHRDLKPANVLITPGGKVMLIDFGLGNVFSHRSRLDTICGSLPYYSPEIARGSNYIGPEVDIWCLGVVLFRMVVGRDPFVGPTKRDVKAMITQGTFRPPSYLSAPLQATLLKLLAHEGCQRRNLGILEGDPWLHGDLTEELSPFLSEDRGMSENSRLSGTTLFRNSSKHTWKRHSQTESYYYGKNGSLLGSRSLLADMAGGGVWQLDKAQPRFHKNRIRLLPSSGAENDQLFRKDVDLSLLQFLMPILWNCRVSYYLHSTSRILCGTSFDRDSSISKNQAAIVLTKFVHHLGAVMTGSLTESTVGGLGTSLARSGVFSIDIVKERGSSKDGYLLIVKRLFGSSSTVQHFKKQFLLNAAPREVGATFI